VHSSLQRATAVFMTHLPSHVLQNIQDKSGVSMGPISLSFADSSMKVDDMTDEELKAQVREEKKIMKSISKMTTAEWREKYEKDGLVDLWVEEEFNSGSRLMVCYVCA
jgi:ferredoxin